MHISTKGLWVTVRTNGLKAFPRRYCISATAVKGLAVSWSFSISLHFCALFKDWRDWSDAEVDGKSGINFANRPILTPKTVLPLFFTVGIIFAPLGGLLLWASAQV